MAKKNENNQVLSENVVVRIWLTEEMLASKPGNGDLFFQFIESKSPDPKTPEQLASEFDIELAERENMCVFLRRTKGEKLPAVEGYTFNGFFKEAITAIKYAKPTSSKAAKISAHKKKIDLGSIISPKYVDIHVPEGEQIGCCQRPLRAQTAQGERIALAASETAPAFSWMEFRIKTTSELLDVIKECLDFGSDHGTGQWRGSGHKGTFVYEMYDADGTLIHNNTERIIGATSDNPEFETLFREFLEENSL